MHSLTPLYTQYGELVDWIAPKRMERLLAGELVTAVRTRKGHIKRLILRRTADDPTPPALADYLGTRYSFQERLDSGRLVWVLRRIGKSESIRPIFKKVVADCLVQS